jgi:hypothetical protein
MKRTIAVGVLGAIVGLLLTSVWLSLEMRHSENGALMRQLAFNAQPNVSFDYTMTVMGKWVRIHEFIPSPLASVLVGLFVGFLCRSRYWLALLIGVTPIVLISYPSDFLSITSGLVCIFAAWICVKSAKSFAALRKPMNQGDATI